MHKRKFKNEFWIFNKKSKDVLLSYEAKQKGKYIKGSIIAIVLGLVIAGIVIAAQNVNPFEYLKNLFDISFGSYYKDQTIQWICIYLIAGLAVAIGFKSGMFNIGVSGQMLIGAGLSIIFIKMAVIDKGHTLTAGYIIVVFIICVFSGAFLSGIAGVLKAVFNIHEVVTTIMLNWTIWYLLKFIFTKYGALLGGEGISSTYSVPSGSLTIDGSTIAIPIILAIISLVVVALLLSKTVFGYKLKAAGLSPSASKYAGFNVSQKMIESMVISGALAGLASFINIFTLAPNITFAIDNLPSIGYDAIAVSLVAFNNPIGALFTSIIWGILQSGGSSAASLFNLPTQMASLVFGIIIYFAAISIVFINYYPILKLRVMIAVTSSKKESATIMKLRKLQNQLRFKLLNITKDEEVQNYREAINAEKQIIIEKYSLLENDVENKKALKAELKVLNKQFSEYVKDYKKTIKENIKKINNDIAVLKDKTYVNKINSAKEGINRRIFKNIRAYEQIALNNISSAKTKALAKEDELKCELDDHINWKSNMLKIAENEYKNNVQMNKVWHEGATGDLTHYYNMFNTKVEAQGDIKKSRVKLKNKIDSLRSEYKMDRMQMINDKKKDFHLWTDIRSLRDKTNEEIKLLKIANKKFIDKKKELIDEVTMDYKETLLSLHKNPTALERLDLELSIRNSNAKKAFEIKVSQIENENNKLTALHNPQKSLDEIHDINNQILKYKDEVKNNDFSTLEKIQEAFDAFEDLQWIINKKWNESFSNYDNKECSLEKMKIYQKVLNIKVELEETKEIYIAKLAIQNIKLEKREINSVYNQEIKGFKTNYKTETSYIKTNKTLTNEQRQILIFEQEDKYKENLENFISDLETSIMNTQVVEGVE